MAGSEILNGLCILFKLLDTINLTMCISTEIFSLISDIFYDYSCTQLADGLVLEKTSSPLGVLLIVFESRPEALVQVCRI